MVHFARIVTRGNVNDIRSDVGALDLFTVSEREKKKFNTVVLWCALIVHKTPSHLLELTHR